MNYFQKKKLFLMSIVNKVKGFIRTVTGSPPITLEEIQVAATCSKIVLSNPSVLITIFLQ